MSLALHRSRHHPVVAALLGAVLVACNAVVGIEDPVEIPIPDGGLKMDAPPVGADGPTSARDRATPGDGSASDATGDVPSMQDVAAGADITPGADVGAARDVTAGGDVTAQDRSVGPVTDSGSGASPSDVRDGGILAAPGLATASCTFSAISGANADTSPYSSTQGGAKRKMIESGEIIDLNLTNFVRGVQRVMNIRLRSPVTTGKTIVLDDVNLVEYYDVKTGYGWGSEFATSRGGTLKIEEVNGASFSFTMTQVKMGPHTNMVGSLGSFTLDGYGTANPQ